MEARGRPLGSRAGFVAIAIALSFAVVAPAQAKFEFITEWGAPQGGELLFPVDVERDGAGNTYIIDALAASVHKYDAANNHLLSWGSPGSGPGQFGTPVAIGVNEPTGEVYVADSEAVGPTLINRIQRFDSNGTFLGQFGSTGTAEGQLDFVRGIAVHPVSGDVYVAEQNRVQRFNAAGVFERMWGKDVIPGGGTGPEICFANCKAGEVGTAEGELALPHGITVDGASVFVSEDGNNRVSRFTTSGTFMVMGGRDVDPGGAAVGETCAVGCQAGLTGTGPGELDDPRGLDFNLTLGRLYIVDRDNNRVQRWDPGLAYQSEFGSAGAADGQFQSAMGLTENQGTVIVTDVDLARAQSFNGANGAFQGRFGEPGPATLVFPMGVAAGPGGVYVTDQFDRVLRFDSQGGVIGSFGSEGSDVGEFSFPSGVTTGADGSVYVADQSNNRVQRFDATGAALGAWGTPGDADGQFNAPVDVAVGRGGSVYVADFGNSRVQRFSPIGTFEGGWGAGGEAPGQFGGVQGIATDSKGNVYVAEVTNERIQKFDRNGNLLAYWGESGSGDGQFDAPADVAVDSAGNVYVVDRGNNRIQQFSPSGKFRGRWGANGGDGTIGYGPGEFNTPFSIAVDEPGYIYVVEAFNNRVQKFAATPKLKLAGKRRQDVERMKLRVTCKQGPCKVKLTGAIEADGGGSAAKPRAAAVKLKKRKLKLASGERQKVKLKLSKANARAAKQLLEGGGGATAKVRGVARNEAGKDKAKRNIGLR